MSEYWEKWEKIVDDGDSYADRGEYAEALTCYRSAIQLFRELAAAQVAAGFTHGTFLANLTLAVPLSRAGELYVRMNRLEESIPFFEEIVSCFQTAMHVAGGKTRSECRRKEANARKRLAEIRALSAKRKRVLTELEHLATEHPAARRGAILLASYLDENKPNAGFEDGAKRAFTEAFFNSAAIATASEDEIEKFNTFIVEHGARIGRVALALFSVFGDPRTILELLPTPAVTIKPDRATNEEQRKYCGT
jgi:tetratricopeptide (TPR) repeat protein